MSCEPCFVASLLALSFTAAGAGAEPVQPARALPHDELRVPFVFEGFVAASDGSPVENAVVVSSAGGKAVTDARGWYRLEASVPAEAESVQVTAVGGAVQGVASTRVVVAASSGRSSVEPLFLARGGSCSPEWLPTFGGHPGTNAPIRALAVFDDGSGPALYAGGGFSSAGGVPANRIARWDGSRWSALESGVNLPVQAMTVFDDGSGPALYVGGQFQLAGGAPANRIARWDGASWSALDSGMNLAVFALTVFDDGGGPALYAGGDFTSASSD